MSMTWNEYIPLAMQTNSDTVGTHGRASLDFMHGAAGLVTELYEHEYAETNLHQDEEIGDCCWFIALCYESISESPKSGKYLGYGHPRDMAIELLDIAKRLFAYGKVKPGDGEKAANLLHTIIRVLEIEDRHMESNIRKLKARYPEGFTQDDAMNRDKDAEYFAIRSETD